MAGINEVRPVFGLSEDLTIADAAAIHQSMLDVLRSASSVTLDGSEVEQVDGAGIQLLAAFMKEAAERQIEIRWQGVSDPLRSAAAQLGLGDFLRLAGTV